MRICTFDLETTNLRANMGRVLCCSFYTIASDKACQVGKTTTLRCDRGNGRCADPVDDASLVEAIRDELEKYNLIVGWNSKMFDAPFLNARLAKAGLRRMNHQLHLDLMYYAGGVSNRIGSRRLASAQQFFDVKSSKTQIDWLTWQRAVHYNTKSGRAALAEVVEHCEADVKVTAEVYWHLLPAVATIHR